MKVVGEEVLRKDGWEKVTGVAKYTNDDISPELYHARMVLSPYAHAAIIEVDVREALKVPGVRAILTGEDFPHPTGPIIADRPPIAYQKVRYCGEPVAVAVADTELHAKLASELIKVSYEPLPVVNSVSESLQNGAPLIHENLGNYINYAEHTVYPVPGTNIANHIKIRKGNIKKGWADSDVIVEGNFAFGPSDHASMEPRTAICEIKHDGRVILHTPSQSPYYVKKYIHRFFDVPIGDVIVHVPLVGGGFGGKGAVQLEYIAYLASKAIGGAKVKVANTREQDLIASPCHIGLEAKIKLAATREGKFTAAEMTLLFPAGGYSDMAVIICKAAAADCSGPYQIENIWCDSYCIYTNHTYATAFRGFGHPELTFARERTMDLLAKRLGMDPLELRLVNAIKPGATSPTQAPLDYSNLGNTTKCLSRLKELMKWDKGQVVRVSPNKVRAKGISCLWKTSSSATDAGAGAVITFNEDGSLNLLVGAVELGQGAKTALAQIVAERMKMDIEKVHVAFDVDTERDPEHWKTVASSTTMLSGRAALEAADDAIQQLKRTASVPLRSLPEDLAVGGGRVFLRANPAIGVDIKDVCMGYMFPNGNSIEGQVIGRGNYIARHLSQLDPETGEGKVGPQWTVAAQGVEVEFDTKACTYKLLKGYTVIDAGKVINPQMARGQMMGGMHMGLSFASREGFIYSDSGAVLNPNLRTYKLIRFGEDPEYVVEFVETPYADGPYGARGIGEYGVIGMAAALGNALSLAAGVELNSLPLTPELIWRKKGGFGP
jgi:CO/xanthine dehydrogenase Mo-binding subunit